MINFINLWLVPDTLVKNPDCLVGLSYALTQEAVPTPMTSSVLNKIITLYKKFPQSRIIVSTGDNQHLGISNAKVMKNYLVRFGVPEEKVIEEDKSSNTFENLVNSGKILTKLELKSPVLITYDLHTRRALATARKIGMKCQSISSSTNLVTMGKRKIWQFNRPTMLLYEVLVFGLSKVVGWA